MDDADFFTRTWNRALTRPEHALALFIAAHVALWTLIPTLVYSAPPLDVVEGYLWGHEWQLGYHKHPPLQAWLLEASRYLGGDWTAYLLAQIWIAATMVLVFVLSRRIIGAAGALVATLLLEGTFYFTFAGPEFNPNIVQMPFWAGAALAFHGAVLRRRNHNWLWLAVCLAALAYAKYSGVILAATFGVFLLADAEARKALRAPWPYLCAAGVVMLLVPHLVWLWRSDFLPMTYALEQRSGSGIGGHVNFAARFFGGQVLNTIGLFVIAALVFTGRRPAALHVPVETPQAADRSYALWVAFGPVVLATLLCLLLGYEFHTMWGAPMLSFLGLGGALLAGRLPIFRPRLAVILLSLALVLPPLVAAGAVMIGSAQAPKPFRTVYPGREIGERFQRLWHAETGKPLRLVIANEWLGGLVSLYAPDRPSVYVNRVVRHSPWAGDALALKHGALVIWPAWLEDFIPTHLYQGLDGFEKKGVEEFRWPYPNQRFALRIVWGIVPPHPEEQPAANAVNQTR